MNEEVKKERLQNRLGPEIKAFRESRRTTAGNYQHGGKI